MRTKKTTTSKLLLMIALSGLFLFSCTEEMEIKPSNVESSDKLSFLNDKNSGARLSSSSESTDVIDFESLAAGTIVSEVFSANGAGPVKVMGFNPNFPDANAAMIFDSSNPTGGDPDLGTPNADFGGPGIGTGGELGSAYENNTALNNVLIITEDFDSSDPDDVDVWGALITLDFSALGDVSIYSMHLTDVEVAENNATVKFYDVSGNLIGSKFVLPKTGDNGVAFYEFGAGVDGVANMEVMLNGSGSIDNIVFLSEEVTPEPPVVAGCTFTQGYWKNHTKYGSPRRDATWDEIGAQGEDTEFFLADASYLEVMQTPKKGNAYYILAPQYIAAKLNMLNGASAPEDVQFAIEGAEAFFSGYTPEEIGELKGSDPLRKQALEFAMLLDQYNNGIIGPGHCDK